MTARKDTTRSTYFVIGDQAKRACAPHTAGGFALKEQAASSMAWTVCEHLSTPEKVLSYHREMDPILIVHGFIICQDCDNRNKLTGQEGFDRMLRSAAPKDDVYFQKFIMKEEVPDTYCQWAKLHPGTNDAKEQRKQVCGHLNTAHKLNTHYASRQALFWHQDSLVCAACLEDMKNGDRQDAVKNDGLKMHGYLFSEQIVGPLCLANSKYFGIK